MTVIFRAAGLAAALVALASAAAAQDPGLPDSSDVLVPDRQFVINLGLGASAGPRYDGSDEILVQPVPLIGFSRLTLPVVGAVGGEESRRGVFFFPTFDYIGSRDSGDDGDLRGTRDVDWALAVGLGVGYRYDWFRAFVQADYGFNGYSGFRGQIGADVVTEPAERVSLSIGPRLAWAGSDYMETYFSVSDDEFAASDMRLAAFEAGSGLRSVGVAAIGSYALSDRVFLLANARYDRLVGDAADSPIVRTVGSENQFTVGLGFTYRFSFDLFDG